MRPWIKFLIEGLVLLVFVGSVLGGGLLVYRSRGAIDECSSLPPDQARDCQYVDDALEDLADPSRHNLARIRCAGYADKADRFLSTRVSGARTKASRYVDACTLLNGGKL